MARWIQIDEAPIPNEGGVLTLFRREMRQGPEFAIRIKGQPGDLMNSRVHGSEDALGTMTCDMLTGRAAPTVLIGGLGMGFTLAAALATLPATAEVITAELVPGVAQWNRTVVGECAGYPLEDPRATLCVADVSDTIQASSDRFDAIILDVDNGPEGMTQESNNQLYSTQGLHHAIAALRRDGVLAVWSASRDRSFQERLRSVGLQVTERVVRAHGGKGARHTIWLAQKSG